MKIKGQINYEILVDEDNNWDLTYDSTSQNDLATIAISQFILEEICVGLSLEKKKAKGEVLRHTKVLLDKGINAKFGTALILEYMKTIYVEVSKAEENDKKQEIESVNLELIKTDSADETTL